MTVHKDILSAVGNTPLVRLNRVVEPGMATVLAKCEFMNPVGAIKERMALHIINRAEEAGLLRPGGTIVENSSGNTALGLAMIAAVRGYRVVITMPDKMSKEKIDMLKAFGVQVVITPTDVPGDSPEHYVNRAKAIAAATPGSYYVNQYHNPWNIEAHELSTGPEIWAQTGGRVDAIVAGAGTGGTVTGIGRFCKRNAQAKAVGIIGVDPLGSVHYSLFHTGELSDPYVYKVEGMGEDIRCDAFDPTFIDDVRQVSDRDCFVTARRLVREEGLFCGGSSGGAAHVALQVARELGPGKTVVAVLPDSGTRYISKFLSDGWMQDHGFLEPERGLGLVEDLLARRNGSGRVITMQPTDTIARAFQLMRENGISQVPIVDATGKPVGIVHEIDVLRGLQTGRTSPGSAVRESMHPAHGMVYPKARIEELYPIFNRDQVALVVNEGRLVAVVSQIDLIEHMAVRK